jgi:hypothetical protein
LDNPNHSTAQFAALKMVLNMLIITSTASAGFFLEGASYYLYA